MDVKRLSEWMQLMFTGEQFAASSAVEPDLREMTQRQAIAELACSINIFACSWHGIQNGHLLYKKFL